MIPNSIADITTEKPSDFFSQKPQFETADYNRLVMQLRQFLTIDQAKKFDEGYTFYKPSTTYNVFLKNIILLYINAIITSFKKNITDDKERLFAVSIHESMQKTIISLFDTLFVATEKLSVDEKDIDVQELSCILLGYATDTLKRAHNNKNIKG
jgi:hypothetical protein